MALRQLRIEGDSILRKRAKEVKNINDRIRQLFQDMEETMVENNGIGIAAPQVGLLKRMIVVNVGQGVYHMVNPEILEKSQEQALDIEGCLSLPNYNGTVERAKKIRVRYVDEEGVRREIEAEDLFARCIQHEVDHLDGVLFRDRVEKEIHLEHPSEEELAYLKEHQLLEKDRDEDAPFEEKEEENTSGEEN